MVDVIPGTSPIQREPVVLDSDAMKSASDDLAMLLASAPARKTRGRPPGSKNKPKTDAEGNFIPPTRRTSAPKDETEEAKQRRKVQEKKELAKKREQQILHELNDTLLGELVHLGIPQDLLFKNGTRPEAKPLNPNYTELAAQIAIPPRVAKMWSLIAAEAEYSDIGNSIMSTVNADSPIRLIILAVVGVVVTVPWVNQLNEVRKNVTQFMEAKARFDAQQVTDINTVQSKVVG
jgi:hypothetical protein